MQENTQTDYLIYDEPAYLNLGKRILENGIYRQEGDEFGRYELFAQPLKFDLLGNKLPLLTTKRVFFKGLAYEMLWFISGKTSIDYLKENNINIWNIWADKNNDVGPLYGYQWNHWRVDPKLRSYIGSDEINQLEKTMKSLKDRPKARSHVISAWRPDHAPAFSIKPCHVLMQFYRIPLTFDQRIKHASNILDRDTYKDIILKVFTEKMDKESIHLLLNKKEIPIDGISLQMTQRLQERLH